MPVRPSLMRSMLALACFGLLGTPAQAQTPAPAYFAEYPNLRMERGADGVLTVTMHNNGGPIRFTAGDHTRFVDAFYDIARDRDNKIVILTGAGGEWMADIDFGSFGDVSDPNGWSRVHDEGTQILENIANIRVPMICAVEGRAWVHSEYCLLANVIVAGEGAAEDPETLEELDAQWEEEEIRFTADAAPDPTGACPQVSAILDRMRAPLPETPAKRS